MASLTADGRIKYQDPTTGKQRAISIRKWPVRERKAIFFHVENLLKAHRYGYEPSKRDVAWRENASVELRKKLADHGLARCPGDQSKALLGPWCASYIDGKGLRLVSTAHQFGLDRLKGVTGNTRDENQG